MPNPEPPEQRWQKLFEGLAHELVALVTERAQAIEQNLETLRGQSSSLLYYTQIATFNDSRIEAVAQSLAHLTRASRSRL